MDYSEEELEEMGYNDLSDEEFQRARRGPHNHLHYTDFLHLRYEWQFAAISALNER